MSLRGAIVNTLLGILLVAVFLLPFLLYVLLAGYALHALELGVEYFSPGADKSLFLVVGVFLGLSLVSTVQSARKRHWQSAFLSFAMLPVLASMWLADPHSPFGLHANFWIFGLLPIFAISEGPGRTRSRFFLTASAICAVIVVNTGLLGSGSLAQITADCVLAGLIIWLAVDARQRWGDQRDTGSKDPLSPNHA